jgi:hypothetical protein
MSQGTLSVGNLTFPAFRGTMNAAFDALKTSNSGTSAPGGAAAGMVWLDTATGTQPINKQSDGSDWISVTKFDTNGNTAKPFHGTGVLGESPFMPDADGTRNLGSPSVRWGTGHFSALQVGTSGDALATYDEGTFTPTMVSSGGGTPTYTTQIGRYTRIGNLVYFGLVIVQSGAGSLAAGNLTIGGLPFTAVTEATSNGGVSIGSVENLTFAAGDQQVTAIVPQGATTVTLNFVQSGAGAQNVIVGDIAGNALVIQIGGQYRTA